MKYLKLSVLFTIIIAISACAPVGGSCKYTDSTEIVQVITLDHPVALQAKSGEIFEVDIELLGSSVEVGQHYELQFRRHTSGGCAPLVINHIVPLD